MSERQWAETVDTLCGAPLLMADDHWGAITQSCDLIAGHEGEHAAELRSCIPVAVLTWPQTALHDRSER